MSLESSPNPYQTVRGSVPDRNTSLLRSFRFWIPAGVCLLALLVAPAAFIIGAAIGNGEAYDNFATHQQQRIEALLASHPDRFGKLTVRKASSGFAYPLGTVSTQADYDLLDEHLNEMFGDELAEQMMYGVDVQGR